ncbi:protein argonaute 4A-like [Senna tora]|uniref:Protein argonaute 4A-like n=1 Tax=Senna tora TaxID=362788 RepID=A0A834WIT1_9FABA|nr:protein argonaute 4A-like [Senna tora]
MASPSPKRLPMARVSVGSNGRQIQLLTNHFRVHVGKKGCCFFQYSVALFYEDGRPVETKGIGRRVIDKVYETYATELQNKNFAYDGEKCLFTLSSLLRNKFEFTVVLDDISSNKVVRGGGPDSPDGSDKKRMRRPSHTKTFKVEISYANKIPMQAIVDALYGQESEKFPEAIRVLDIILRHRAAKQGYLLVRQSFFNVNSRRNYGDLDLGGGVRGCRGFHSSFRATQGGLTLNIDVSTTPILEPGSVVEFLLKNQNVRHASKIDWTKAKRMLKNLRIKANNIEYKITGLSDKPCKDQTFPLRQGRDANGEVQSIEVTVREYFERHKKIPLRDSIYLPCINVGKPKRPSYFPMELCTLVSLQRYTKALTDLQRAALVEKSRQKPQQHKKALADVCCEFKNNYGNEPMLCSSGITVDPLFTRVEGRVLQAPRLSFGNGENFLPRNGRWNFNNRKLAIPVEIKDWAVVNFSAGDKVHSLVRSLMECARMKGVTMDDPTGVFEEEKSMRCKPAPIRVEKMYEIVKQNLSGRPQLLLCILPQRKNSHIYGPWKKRNLVDEGVVTQCVALPKMNNQYLTNVLLKINAKLGGMNSFLAIEKSPSNIPLVSRVPTLILGMDVSHGSPGRDVPSIAAVVSSRYWPLISQYRASVRSQSPKVELIANLFKPGSNGEDDGIFRELLEDFIATSGSRPEHIIIFRDGVSESQFNQVLNIELDQIIQACKHYKDNWNPKFTLIIAQKNHHTKFFHARAAKTGENVPPGTVIDNGICHPKNNDFYMCAHTGRIGTSRPTHYHVLCNEIGFSTDGLQELVHCLSYVYQRSTTAVSVVAPICYAHLAAAQVAQFIKFDESSESSSSHGGHTSAGAPHVPPELPRLHKSVANSMFFC